MHPTIWPKRIRFVRWLMAAITVQHSNTASWAGRGTLWKWSYTQIESYPSSSARTAISSDFAHFAVGSSIDASSIFQPWGMNAPKITSLAMTAKLEDAADPTGVRPCVAG